jgi:hypothetical protein
MAKQFLIDTPLPDTTRTYKCISHKQLMDITLESLDKCGFELSKEIYTSSAGGNKANGKYYLKYGNDHDMGLMIAWQNSYDKSLSLKFGVGTHVWICENGLICADMARFKSKHVGQVQTITPAELKEAICRAGEGFEHMILQKERMKEIEVSKKVQAELLGRMFIQDAIINSTQLNIIKGQIEKPEFDYGFKGSVWETLNHVTYSQRTATPDKWMERSMKTHKFFIEEFNIA